MDMGCCAAVCSCIDTSTWDCPPAVCLQLAVLAAQHMSCTLAFWELFSTIHNLNAHRYVLSCTRQVEAASVLLGALLAWVQCGRADEWLLQCAGLR